MPSPSKSVSPALRDNKPGKVGEVRITFLDNRNFDIKIEGAVTLSLLQRSRRALYKAVSKSKSIRAKEHRAQAREREVNRKAAEAEAKANEPEQPEEPKAPEQPEEPEQPEVKEDTNG